MRHNNVLLVGFLAFACSRDAAIRNSLDAARAICCYAHIKQGKTPNAAEIACQTLEAVQPFIAKTETAAETVVEYSGPEDAGKTD